MQAAWVLTFNLTVTGDKNRFSSTSFDIYGVANLYLRRQQNLYFTIFDNHTAACLCPYYFFHSGVVKIGEVPWYGHMVGKPYSTVHMLH